MNMPSNLPRKFNQDGPKKRKEPFGDLMKSMNDFFQKKPVRGFLQSMDDFFRSPFPFQALKVNMTETESHYLLIAELPGIKKEQVKIEIMQDKLTITVHNSEKIIEEDEKNNFFLQSQTIQNNKRTLHFHQPIDERRIRASYQDGLLKIKVPKKRGKNIVIEHE